MPRASRFLRSASLLLAAAVVGRGSMTIASVLVARTISPQDFGRLTLVQTTVTFLAGLAALGLNVAVTRQVAAARVLDVKAAGAYLGTALAVTAAAGLLVCASYLIWWGAVASRLLRTPGAEDLVLASAGAILFTALTLTLHAGLLGLEAFRYLAVAQTVQGIAVGAGLVAGAEAGGPRAALLGLSAGNAVAAVAAWRLLEQQMRAQRIALTLNRAAQAWRRLWRLALPSLAASLVLYIALLWGQTLLSRQPDGYRELAVFNLAYRWHLAVVFVPAAIAPLLMPMMTRLLTSRGEAEARRLFRLNLRLSTGLTLAPACVLIVAAGQILGLSGSFYAAHTAPLVVLALAAVPTALNNTLSAASLSAGRIRAWLLSDVALAGALVATAALLVPAHLATGLAVAYLAGYVATVAVLGLTLYRRPPVVHAAEAS